ncbi:MAG: outer membrane beta-barrel protein [Mucilaginibacter sp.]
MIHHRRFLSFLFLFIPFITFAQSNFKAGYIVSTKGDTIRGLVDYKEWEFNPGKIFFKETINSPEVSYAPGDISFFAINGFEYYRSAFVKISQGGTNVDKLSGSTLAGIDSAYLSANVFLRVIFGGSKASLYSYKDAIKERFYIGQGDITPDELIYIVYLDETGTNKLIKDTYKRQLQKIAATYDPQNSKLLRQIQNAKYAESDIRQIVEQVNVDKDAKYAIEKRASTRYYAGVGINNGKINFLSNSDYFKEKRSASSARPKIAVGLDILINKNVGKLIFRNEISFSMARGNFSYTGTANTPYTGSIQLDQIAINYTPQILYNFYNTNAAKVYFTVGPGINYAKYSNKKQKLTYTIGDEILETESDFLVEPETFFFNIYIGAGVVVNKKFDIYLGYIPATVISTGAPKLEYTSLQVGVNYLFGSK